MSQSEVEKRVRNELVDAAEEAIDRVGPDRHLREYAVAAVDAVLPAIEAELRESPENREPNKDEWFCDTCGAISPEETAVEAGWEQTPQDDAGVSVERCPACRLSPAKDRCPTCLSSNPYWTQCIDRKEAEEETGREAPERGDLRGGCLDPWHEDRIARLSPENSSGVEEGRWTIWRIERGEDLEPWSGVLGPATNPPDDAGLSGTDWCRAAEVEVIPAAVLGDLETRIAAELRACIALEDEDGPVEDSHYDEIARNVVAKLLASTQPNPTTHLSEGAGDGLRERLAQEFERWAKSQEVTAAQNPDMDGVLLLRDGYLAAANLCRTFATTPQPQDERLSARGSWPRCGGNEVVEVPDSESGQADCPGCEDCQPEQSSGSGEGR